MTQYENFAENYYDDYPYVQNDDGNCDYHVNHMENCRWCDKDDRDNRGADNHNFMMGNDHRDENYDYQNEEDAGNYRQQVENHRNVYWEDEGDCNKEDPKIDRLDRNIINGKISGEILCPHCNYYVNAETESGAKWYISLLSTVLLPCCLCWWLPRFTRSLTTPRHRCPICSHVILVKRTSSYGEN